MVVLTTANAVFSAELERGVVHHPVAAPTTPRPADPRWVQRLADDLYVAVLRHRLGVLSVHYGVGLAAAAIAARERLGARGIYVRVCVTLHGTDVTHLTQDVAQAQSLRAAVLAADAVTAVSPSLARAAARRLRLSRAPRVIANGVDTDLFRPAPIVARLQPRPADQPRVLCHASNFRPVKRPLDCIDIVAKLRHLGTPTQLLMIGDGPLRPAAREHAHATGVLDAVTFIDPLPQAQLAAHLRAADVALVTSECESFGLVALEAMASGTVLMGWQCEGLTDLLQTDPQLAPQLLAPLGDFDTLAQRLEQLLATEHEYEAARRRCLEIGRTQFRRSTQLDRYEALLSPATSGHGAWAADAKT